MYKEEFNAYSDHFITTLFELEGVKLELLIGTDGLLGVVTIDDESEEEGEDDDRTVYGL